MNEIKNNLSDAFYALKYLSFEVIKAPIKGIDFLLDQALHWTQILPSNLSPPPHSYPDLYDPKVRDQLSLSDEEQGRFNEAFKDLDLIELSTQFVLRESNEQIELPPKINPLNSHYMFKHADFPGFIFKITPPSQHPKTGFVSSYGCPLEHLQRVPMAEVMRTSIEEEKLERLYVPKKYLASLPNGSDKLDASNYVVLAEELDLMSMEEAKNFFKQLPEEEATKLFEQIWILCLKTGFQDAHIWNFSFIRSGPHKGKLALYDTEPLGLLNTIHGNCGQFHNSWNKKEIQEGLFFAIQAALWNVRWIDDYTKEISEVDSIDYSQRPVLAKINRLGGAGLIRLGCAEYAFGQMSDPERGLPISKTILHKVHDRLLTKAKRSACLDAIKGAALTALPILVGLGSWIAQKHLEKLSL